MNPNTRVNSPAYSTGRGPNPAVEYEPAATIFAQGNLATTVIDYNGALKVNNSLLSVVLRD
jgi:hypothetical protein